MGPTAPGAGGAKVAYPVGAYIQPTETGPPPGGGGGRGGAGAVEGGAGGEDEAGIGTGFPVEGSTWGSV